jgi:hypothetical protein
MTAGAAASAVGTASGGTDSVDKAAAKPPTNLKLTNMSKVNFEATCMVRNPFSRAPQRQRQKLTAHFMSRTS